MMRSAKLNRKSYYSPTCSCVRYLKNASIHLMLTFHTSQLTLDQDFRCLPSGNKAPTPLEKLQGLFSFPYSGGEAIMLLSRLVRETLDELLLPVRGLGDAFAGLGVGNACLSSDLSFFSPGVDLVGSVVRG